MGRIFEVRKHAMFARWNRMAKQFARIGKDITISVRNGGADPASNPTLRRVIESVARLHAMPWSRVLEAGTEQDGEPAPPWCPLPERLTLLARPAAAAYAADGNAVGQRFLAGWDAFERRASAPARALIDRLGTERVSEAIGQLPEEYGVVCTLYFMEDFAYHEIADVLEVPVGTVRSRLHRGRNSRTSSAKSRRASVTASVWMPLATRTASRPRRSPVQSFHRGAS